MIKASDEHPILVASYRLLIAAFVLFPFFLRDLRQYEGKYGWTQVGWSIAPAVALAVHFMTWVVGARLTAVANASFIVNLIPVAMPFFVWFFFKERINRQEIIGTIITLAGMVVLVGAKLDFSKPDFQGDLICFFSMLCYAAYLALGRKNGGRLSLWLYMVPLYFIAGMICLLCGLVVINPIKTYSLKNVLLILGLGLIPTVVGHTLMNYSLKFFRGQVISVANLAQPVFAVLLGILFFSEIPQPSFYPAAGLFLVGSLVVLNGSQRHPTRK